MDHNLDSLNLESAMGVDFESTESVEVSRTDLALSSSNDEGIPMEFEQIEEQPMLMDTGGEEIIDFMGDQFTLQEYSVQDDQTTGLTTTAESNQNVLSSQTGTLIDLQLQPQASFITESPKIISVKAAIPARPPTCGRRGEGVTPTAPVPRQVAIAPKPPRLAAKLFNAGKQFAIAPKPLAVVKKVSLANVQTNTKGSTVLAQFGKQLVMMPAGAQKLKLVAAGPAASAVQYVRGGTDQTSLIQPKDQKPLMMAKVIMPGQPNVEVGEQPVVMSKVSAQPPARFVAVQQKSVPIAIGSKVVMASPTKQAVKINKNKSQIITIKSPTPHLLPAPPAASATKQVVLSSNPAQNVILKTTAPPKTAQIGKDGNVVIEGQQTQLHQISVPGKGIQYIRLVTNTNTAAAKPKVSGSLLSMPSKFVLADNKAGGKKLVRIAPVGSKSTVTPSARSSQSLLAPLSPAAEPSPAQALGAPADAQRTEPDAGDEPRALSDGEDADSKPAIESLMESAEHEHGQDMQEMSMTEVEIQYQKPHSPKVRHKSLDEADHEVKDERLQHSIIVIPTGYEMSNNLMVPDDAASNDENQRSLLNMESDSMNAYQSPQTPQPTSESEMVPTELGLRPRKACNCNKSQCLKLYCDCFANGEFCNRCNCSNCYNNLENEELRQKAIRGCLDRNPNAFRPKIGKAKIGGPEIVRRHNKGCNCKRSGCLKNYCECYEAKIACTAICKCVGCRNVEESLERFRRQELPAKAPKQPFSIDLIFRNSTSNDTKQPCSFMTGEVIEAVCQCLLAAAGEAGAGREPLRDVIDEFARCLQDIIGAAHHAPPAHPAAAPPAPAAHAPAAPAPDQGTS